MKDQRGAVVIVEAVFVFPIMFFVIFIMLMACEAYYQYARVERACLTAAVQGAARCENPMQEAVEKNGSVPTSTTAVKVRPYRYIFPGEAKAIGSQVAGELTDRIEGMNNLAFRGMTPSDVSVRIKPKMSIFVSSFAVDCSFKVKLPIRMIFTNESLAFSYRVSVTEPIGDPAEFVRNVSTVEDYLERSQISDAISEYTKKIQEAFGKLGRFFN